jgi:Zn-dependent M28 family amino/carboxypeptidase
MRMTALAAAATVAALVVVSPDPATAAPAFDVARARTHTAALAEIGPRREGSAAEIAGADYVTARLEEAGYAVRTQHVRLPNGSFSHNVVAVKAGASPRRVVLGAHLDTKSGSPGANDNGSGVGVVLELARVLKDAPTQPTIVFAFFGAEEMWDGNADHHHYGSRAYVRGLSPAQRRRISGMISVDMVGYGRFFLVRTMHLSPMTLANRLQTVAAGNKLRLRYSRDPSRVGWSDHEPFEKAGIPVAWLNWKSDPLYHTPGDTAERLEDGPMRTTGLLLERYLTGMTARQLRAMRR